MYDFETMRKRILGVLKEFDLDYEFVSNGSGLPLDKVSDILDGKITDPHISEIISICKAIDMPACYILFGIKDLEGQLAALPTLTIALNDEGRQKVVDYITDLERSKRYEIDPSGKDVRGYVSIFDQVDKMVSLDADFDHMWKGEYNDIVLPEDADESDSASSNKE